MLQVAAKHEEAIHAEMETLCKNLFKEWLFDLTFEEKQIWLWNALVDLKKIKQSKKP